MSTENQENWVVLEGGNEPYRREKTKKRNCYLPGKINVTSIIKVLTRRKTLQEVRKLVKGGMILGTHQQISHLLKLKLPFLCKQNKPRERCYWGPRRTSLMAN